METLNVKPPMLLKVEELAQFVVDFSVPMRPHTSLAEPKQGMHSCSEKIRTILFSKKIQKSYHSVLHGFFEELRRFEGHISLYLHDV